LAEFKASFTLQGKQPFCLIFAKLFSKHFNPAKKSRFLLNLWKMNKIGEPLALISQI